MAFTLLSGAAVAGDGIRAFACTCAVGARVCQTYWTAGAVFDATVEGIDATSREEEMGGRMFTLRENIVHLNVRHAWKGVDARSLDVVTAAEGGMCGYDFKPGKRYLVFAERSTDGRWAVSSCSQTHEFDGTAEDAAFLNRSRPRRRARASSDRSRRWSAGSTASRPTLSIPSKRKSTCSVTDRNASRRRPADMFEFTGLAKGAIASPWRCPTARRCGPSGNGRLNLPTNARARTRTTTWRRRDASPDAWWTRRDGRRNRSLSRPTSPTRADNRAACRCRRRIRMTRAV